jgi:hypothetical protein
MAQAERLLAVSLKEFNLVPDRNVQRQAATVLLKMVTNIKKTPNEQYRRICCDNPVIQNQLLSVRGARTALRGIGFAMDENGEFYEYNDTDLGRSSEFLQAFLDELNRRDQDGETEGSTGKNFVRRQGPSTNEGFKRFKDGLEGLQQRWAELELVVRVPITNKETYVEAKKGVAAAQAFLSLLESVAQEVDLLQGVIMQSISGDGAGHGGDSTEVAGKVEESKIKDLREGMLAIRSLIRLKITDDADLDTARRSVLDITQFFALLEVEAQEQKKDEFEVLQSL